MVVLVKEYLPAAKAVACNELLVLSHLCGGLPEFKWPVRQLANGPRGVGDSGLLEDVISGVVATLHGVHVLAFLAGFETSECQLLESPILPQGLAEYCQTAVAAHQRGIIHCAFLQRRKIILYREKIQSSLDHVLRSQRGSILPAPSRRP